MFHGKGGRSPRSSHASCARLINATRFVLAFLLLGLIAPVQAASFGATPGEFSVSPSGAATYSNGIVGTGWLVSVL